MTKPPPLPLLTCVHAEMDRWWISRDKYTCSTALMTGVGDSCPTPPPPASIISLEDMVAEVILNHTVFTAPIAQQVIEICACAIVHVRSQLRSANSVLEVAK